MLITFDELFPGNETHQKSKKKRINKKKVRRDESFGPLTRLSDQTAAKRPFYERPRRPGGAATSRLTLRTPGLPVIKASEAAEEGEGSV